MPSQIVLAWTVDVTNSPYGPTQAAAALSAVPLYDNVGTDPVLGQFFGLNVDSDVTTPSGTTVTRMLTLNMAGAGAPPPFPCQPDTSTPPTLPYELRKAVTLPGSFFVANGLFGVATTATQIPNLQSGDLIQFLSQPGVFYEVATVLGATQIVLTAAYSGITSNTTAFKTVATPVTNVAVYSTSPFDTNGVATTPAIPAGNGARSVELIYHDSTGAGPFTATVGLTGKRPAAVPLAVGSIDIAVIDNFILTGTGVFGNSAGQITLAELSEPLPMVQANATALDFLVALTDEAQLLIDRPLVYLPQSYFAVAQQNLSETFGTPSNDELSGPLGEFVALEVAAPPPNPPLDPSTIPAPTFLSGLFTKTLQLALAVPVTPQPITFA